MGSEWWLTASYRQHELPFLIAHLSLWTEDGRTRVDAGQGVPMLYGNLVSAVDQLEDMAGNQGLFFCFPDVSVRQRGRYSLCISLVRLPGYVYLIYIASHWKRQGRRIADVFRARFSTGFIRKDWCVWINKWRWKRKYPHISIYSSL